MLPYILKICGFKNSIVYTFYSMYQKYTFFVKLYICGLTYRLFIRYIHKLRIDVITYIPTLANWQMTLPLLLSVYYRYYRTGSGPSSTGYRNIRTSEDVLLHRYGLLRFDGGFVGWDPSWPGISSRRGSLLLLRWVARKNFIAKSPADPSRNPQMMMDVAQRG